MELDDGLARSFAYAALECYDLSDLELDREKALVALAAEYRDNFADLDDEEVKERRWNHCKIPGTTPEDFKEWIVPVGEGRHVICGIRHLGMNLEKPFVQVCPNFAFRNSDEAKSIYAKHLCDRFAVFHPHWIQVYTPTGEESEAGGSLTLVARSKSILSMSNLRSDTNLQLANPTCDAYYQWYSDSYDAFHREFPEKQDWVQKNDLDLMRACREDGLLRLVNIGEETVGLIAAERSPFLGYDGIYFVEILVTKKWRRKGIAKAVQQQFVEETCREETIVWGLIDRSNEASIRTALANGRRIVRGECFLSVDEG